MEKSILPESCRVAGENPELRFPQSTARTWGVPRRCQEKIEARLAVFQVAGGKARCRPLVLAVTRNVRGIYRIFTGPGVGADNGEVFRTRSESSEKITNSLSLLLLKADLCRFVFQDIFSFRGSCGRPVSS
ncbi:MAG: hypothetical protein QGH40_17455, partial [bacterium]|nr:hypothetical protein [bacterium]